MFFFKKTFFYKIVLSRSLRKTQKLRILRGKMNQNVIFCAQIFFQKLLYKYNFFFKFVVLNFFFFKIVLLHDFFLQNHAF